MKQCKGKCKKMLEITKFRKSGREYARKCVDCETKTMKIYFSREVFLDHPNFDSKKLKWHEIDWLMAGEDLKSINCLEWAQMLTSLGIMYHEVEYEIKAEQAEEK